MDRCSKCGNKVRSDGGASVLGESLCGSCKVTHDGLAIGVMSGMVPGSPVGSGVAGVGILGWIRGALNRKPKK